MFPVNCGIFFSFLRFKRKEKQIPEGWHAAELNVMLKLRIVNTKPCNLQKGLSHVYLQFFFVVCSSLSQRMSERSAQDVSIKDDIYSFIYFQFSFQLHLTFFLECVHNCEIFKMVTKKPLVIFIRT